MQESYYLLNLISQAFISQFIYYLSKASNLTVSLLVSDILGTQPKRKHRGALYFGGEL